MRMSLLIVQLDHVLWVAAARDQRSRLLSLQQAPPWIDYGLGTFLRRLCS